MRVIEAGSGRSRVQWLRRGLVVVVLALLAVCGSEAWRERRCCMALSREM